MRAVGSAWTSVKTRDRSPQAAEERRVRRLRARELHRRIANLQAANASPEQIARVQRNHRMEEATRAYVGGSNRIRRLYGVPFDLRTPRGEAPLGGQYDSHEQLPQSVEAYFASLPGMSGPVTQMYINSRPAGRPLGDHGREPGFRWHNALHVAFAVGLGWSPVLRSVLSLERLSDPFTANVEDGHASREVEEQVAWAVFLDARAHAWYERTRPGRQLLRRVRMLTATLEV